MVNPRMLSLTLTDANTNYSLLELLQTADPSGFSGLGPFHVQSLQIQVDIDAGAARVYIGNSDISGTNHGRVLVATQADAQNSWQGTSVVLSAIYVRSNTATTVIHVEVLQ